MFVLLAVISFEIVIYKATNMPSTRPNNLESAVIPSKPFHFFVSISYYFPKKNKIKEVNQVAPNFC